MKNLNSVLLLHIKVFRIEVDGTVGNIPYCNGQKLPDPLESAISLEQLVKIDTTIAGCYVYYCSWHRAKCKAFYFGAFAVFQTLSTGQASYIGMRLRSPERSRALVMNECSSPVERRLWALAQTYNRLTERSINDVLRNYREEMNTGCFA